MSTLRCLGDCYLIQADPIEISYKGSLVLPDAHSQWDTFRTGVIIAKGAACREDIQIGDRVTALKYQGAKFTHEQKEYISIREAELDLLWISSK